jgi:hypothetical protein
MRSMLLWSLRQTLHIYYCWRVIALNNQPSCVSPLREDLSPSSSPCPIAVWNAKYMDLLNIALMENTGCFIE